MLVGPGRRTLSKMIPWTGQKNLTSRFALTFLLRNRCRSSLDMFQVRVARRSGAFFVFKRCQRPAGDRGDYHRHRFQNANFAQITVRSRSCGKCDRTKGNGSSLSRRPPMLLKIGAIGLWYQSFQKKEPVVWARHICYIFQPNTCKISFKFLILEVGSVFGHHFK